MKRILFAGGLTMAILLVTAASAAAAGFALYENSVKGLGTGFSGTAARAEDPSTIFFNPAGMTLLEGQQAQGAVHLIIPDITFTKEEATNVLGTPLSGGEGGQGGVTSVAPNAYYTNNPGNDWAFGIGVSVPFGLATKYNRTWVGRYHAVESEIITLNINPSVAYRVNKHLSLGAGFNAQYIDALLSQMVDYGLLASSENPLLPASLASNPNADIYSEVNADDWSYGYNLGLLYEFNETTRVGLSYRSEIQHELEGDVAFEVPSTFLASVDPALATAAETSFTNQGARGDLDLPANAELSLFHRLGERWTLLADVQWIGWSSFDKLIIEFEDGSKSVTTENWEDTWRYGLGTTYDTAGAWTLRGGVTYDETPIPDAEHRTPRLPGEDRIWLALGAGYERENLSLDFGYAHIFVDDARINQIATPTNENSGRGNLKGEFDFSAEIFSVAATYRF